MFIGHFGVALGAKRVAPTVSLGTLILAAQLIDLVWPILLLLGVEHVRIDPGNTAYTPLDFYNYPITHSLLLVVVWSVLFGAVYYAVRKGWMGAVVLACAVLSHWVLDFLTHRPDLPLAPGADAYAGLGLWNSVAATLIVEWSIFIGGVVLYAMATRARDRTGLYAFWGLVAFLAVSSLAAMSSVPPNAEAVAYGSLLAWLFVPWGYWIDRHREPALAVRKEVAEKKEME